jgi:hypothetical protein
MENLWITLAEVAMEPGDVPSGDTLGFMWITMWASSSEDFRQRLTAYLEKYKWKLLSMEETEVVDPSQDRGDTINQMIDESLRDRDAVRLGTFHSCKPN